MMGFIRMLIYGLMLLIGLVLLSVAAGVGVLMVVLIALAVRGIIPKGEVQHE